MAAAALEKARCLGCRTSDASNRKPLPVTENAAVATASPVSNTRFVQGGDHFMTTPFNSAAIGKGSPVSREEFLADCVEP